MFLRSLIVILAIFSAFAPVPPGLVERTYATDLYPHIQQILTSISNLTPFALFDVMVTLAGVGLVMVFMRRRRSGWLRGLALTAADALAVAAALYLVFLVTWGLNYRRQPLAARLDFDRARVSTESVATFARRVVSELNRLAPLADLRAWPTLDELNATMGDAAAKAQRATGVIHLPVPGRPKPTMLTWYFRQAGIDGMTNPFMLETLVNGDLLPMERPFVVAHEWAHLAGYADESEANFVAWLTGTMGTEQLRYSGWLGIYGYALGAMSPTAARALSQRLSPEVQKDLRDIASRHQRANRAVQRVATSAYDRYLKANRVPEGVRSYQGVLALVVGTRFADDGTPVLRVK